MTRLNRLQIAPYARELRGALDSSLYCLGRLEESALACLQLEAQLITNVEGDKSIDNELFDSKARTHTHIFDRVEAFLAAFARVSFLIFPVGRRAFTITRAATLQECLKLDERSPIADRDLRDSWVHYDERIDQAITAKIGTNGHTFRQSATVDDLTKRTYLRIFEIDTLKIHYRNRAGNSSQADLRALGDEIEQVTIRLPRAFDTLGGIS